MPTYTYEVYFTASDAGEVEAEDEQEAREMIEDMIYAVSTEGGYKMSWDGVEIVSFELEEEEDEDA
jgi:hypothetical protein